MAAAIDKDEQTDRRTDGDRTLFSARVAIISGMAERIWLKFGIVIHLYLRDFYAKFRLNSSSGSGVTAVPVFEFSSASLLLTLIKGKGAIGLGT